MTQDFNKLQVYKEAYELSKEIYNSMSNIKKHFRLKEQLFGSATSVPANLAEMAAMDNKNQQAQKVRICLGECNETKFWLSFCKDNGLIVEQACQVYIGKIRKIRAMLYGLLESIKAENARLRDTKTEDRRPKTL